MQGCSAALKKEILIVRDSGGVLPGDGAEQEGGPFYMAVLPDDPIQSLSYCLRFPPALVLTTPRACEGERDGALSENGGVILRLGKRICNNIEIIVFVVTPVTTKGFLGR